MALIKSLVSALSTYSAIPMPNIKYNDGDGRFTLIFFPFVGIIIAGLEYLIVMASVGVYFNDIAEAMLAMAIPLLVTGGLHVDGYMDTMDAIHSYGDKEKRLEILKDPHIGAFSVIKLLTIVILALAMYAETMSYLYKLVFAGFIVSRICSALSILFLDLAKADGMVAYTKRHASNACGYVLFIELFVVLFWCFKTYRLIALWPVLAVLFCFLYYRSDSKRKFGGITGDTSGCFLIMTEFAWLFSIFIYSLSTYL